MCIPNSKIVEYLSNGYTIPEISLETKLKIKTIERRIYVLKKISNTTTAAHLVANYIRKNIIN